MWIDIFSFRCATLLALIPRASSMAWFGDWQLLLNSSLFWWLLSTNCQTMRKLRKSWTCEWNLQSKQKTSMDMHLATDIGTVSCWSDFIWVAGSAHWIIHGTICKSLCCSLPFPRMELKKTHTEQEQAGSMHGVHSTQIRILEVTKTQAGTAQLQGLTHTPANCPMKH